MVPLVSVVIPTHNRKLWVMEAIESAFNQSYLNIELVLVDDGSTDCTVKSVTDAFGTRIKKIIHHDIPLGVGAARNVGAQACTGEYIAFLDSDDIWPPNSVQDKVDIFLKSTNDKLAIVGAGCNYIDENAKPILKSELPPTKSNYEEFAIKIRLPGSGSNNLILKSVFDSLGGFDTSLLHAEDKELWMRILMDHSIDYTNNIGATIRIHSTPRLNVDNDVIFKCRIQVSNTIKKPLLRRKAIAHDYYMLFDRSNKSDYILAFGYLVRSFLVYPFPIMGNIKRIRSELSRYINY